MKFVLELAIDVELAYHISMYLVDVHWNEIHLLSFMCDVCNEVHDNMQWLSELWWYHNTVITSL